MHQVPAIILALIVIGYACIAAQMWLARSRAPSTEGSRAMWLLVGIFVCCGMAGYAPHLFAFLRPIETPIHLVLLILTWWFIFTNKAADIMRALK